MKKVYFVFYNMKEAEYYFKSIAYYLEVDYKIKKSRNPFSIITPRIKKKNIIEKIFGRKEDTLEIIFKSENSNLEGILEENIYHFFGEYDYCYFFDLLKEI